MTRTCYFRTIEMNYSTVTAVPSLPLSLSLSLSSIIFPFQFRFYVVRHTANNLAFHPFAQFHGTKNSETTKNG